MHRSLYSTHLSLHLLFFLQDDDLFCDIPYTNRSVVRCGELQTRNSHHTTSYFTHLSLNTSTRQSEKSTKQRGEADHRLSITRLCQAPHFCRMTVQSLHFIKLDRIPLFDLQTNILTLTQYPVGVYKHDEHVFYLLLFYSPFAFPIANSNFAHLAISSCRPEKRVLLPL